MRAPIRDPSRSAPCCRVSGPTGDEDLAIVHSGSSSIQRALVTGAKGHHSLFARGMLGEQLGALQPTREATSVPGAFR